MADASIELGSSSRGDRYRVDPTFSTLTSSPSPNDGSFVDPFSLTPTACMWQAVFSTLGSVFTKLAFGGALGSLVLRVLCLVLMLASNAIGLKYYVAALQQHSSFQVSVLTFALGFIATGIAGSVFFGEVMTLRWLAGSCLIVLGIGTVVSASPEKLRKRK